VHNLTVETDRKPVIGLTARTFWYASRSRMRLGEMISSAYLEGVLEAGGLPLVLANRAGAPAAGAYLDRLDGLLLTGGEDVHPHRFDEEPARGIEAVDEDRDRLEIELVRGARARDLPLFAICRGVQVMNVALGGDLFQDIASQTGSRIAHTQTTLTDSSWHAIDVAPGTLLARVLRPGRLSVNSWHHQACRRVAAGLRVSATSPSDGVVEALEDPSLRFFLGVQWHPELAAAAGDPDAKRLFRAFVEACEGGGVHASSNPKSAAASRR